MDEDTTLGRIGGFRLIKRLATGGTSDVLLARAEGPHGFERTVVLKRLLTEHQNDPDFARMFAREAAAYARLSHPAIVRLFDFFTANGQLVMVLEYVDGISLAKLMTHAAQTGDKLDDRACFFIAARIFDALSAAHDARNPDTGDPTPVIHRDVNPSNVLIPWDGHAKLADFGIAKITGGGDEAFGAETRQGLIKGTYGYMAPEQVRGERVTIRTDIYAATLVLWELLARRKAIQADKLPEMEILRAMAEPNLPKLDVMRPDLHESVREAVARGLEPNPAKRSITAEEMMGILRAHFDAEDARQRLERAMAPLAEAAGAKGRRSLPDATQPNLAVTTDGAAMALLPTTPAFTPAMTLPIPTAPRPVPRPQSYSAPATAGAPQASAAQAQVMQVQQAPEPLRRQTPSGFRAVPAPAPPIAAPVYAPPQQPTMAGGFMPAPLGSEPATLETHKIDGAALLPWPPPPPAFGSPQHPSAYPPVMPGPPPRRSFALTIVLALLAGIMVVGFAGAIVVYVRLKQTEAEATVAATVTATPPPASTTKVTGTGTGAATATVTATVAATVTATATVSASVSPTATATVAPTATSATGTPTPASTRAS